MGTSPSIQVGCLPRSLKFTMLNTVYSSATELQLMELRQEIADSTSRAWDKLWNVKAGWTRCLVEEEVVDWLGFIVLSPCTLPAMWHAYAMDNGKAVCGMNIKFTDLHSLAVISKCGGGGLTILLSSMAKTIHLHVVLYCAPTSSHFIMRRRWRLALSSK